MKNRPRFVTFVVIVSASLFGSGFGDFAKFMLSQHGQSLLAGLAPARQSSVGTFLAMTIQIIFAYAGAFALPSVLEKYSDKSERADTN